jgi:hypothetical protein
VIVRVTAAALGLAAATMGVGADKNAPLRTMTYAVDFTVRSSQTNHISALAPDANRAIGPGSSNIEEHGFTIDDSGTLQVVVVAATADGGLVTDVKYDGKQTHQPLIRVAIAKDGRLLYDPKQPLSEPAARVLPLLARETFSKRELAAGTAWSEPVQAPAKGSTTYRVVTVAAPDVTVAVSATLDVPGSAGFSEHEDGTLTFATDVLAPLRWDVLIHVMRTRVGGAETTDGHLTARLTGDTFPRRSKP